MGTNFMNKKIWGIIIVIAALAIIAGIVYIIFFYRFSSQPEQAVRAPAPTAPAKTSAESAVEPPPVLPTAALEPPVEPKKTEIEADDLARMASAFAERFGSFSNQSDYDNIRDLEIFMTDSLKSWAENYVNDVRVKKTQTAIYYGIITKAISNEVKKFDAAAGQAEILVKTQRRETAGVSGNSSTFYQDIIIKYGREQGVWRVDGIYWQAK